MIVPSKLEDYAARHSTAESSVLKRLTRATYRQTELPQMQVGHLEGSFLRLLVKISRAKRVLEIGTFTGYSALAMAQGFGPSGRLITCDVDPVATRIAQRYWAQSPQGKKIELRLGNALRTIPHLRGLFDLVFIDADKENYIRYWDLCVPKVKQGGILLVDNVLWGGRVLQPTDSVDRAMVSFNRHVLLDRRVELVMLPLRDGVTLAYRK